MRIFFGGGKDDRLSQRQRRRQEEVEHAREERYLRDLSRALEGGKPVYKLHEKEKIEEPVRAEATAPPEAPAPQGAAAEQQPPAEKGEGQLVPAPSSNEDPFISLPGDEISPLGGYSYGDIILLSDDTIGIYSRYIPEKEYDVVHMLRPDGSLDPKGLPLAAHQATTIGRLTAAGVRHCFLTNSWERDLIVFHLYEYSHTKRVPHPTVPRNSEGKPVTAHHASETPEAEHRSPLVRGRRLAIGFGDRTWEAIHWGHDEQGALVAHNTSGEWALMHLDLSRFEASIDFLELLEPEEIQEIERGLIASSGEQSSA